MLQTSFMGRSIPVVSGARAASQVTSRSFVFGRGDSNSAAPPEDGTDNVVQVGKAHMPELQCVKMSLTLWRPYVAPSLLA